MISKIIQDTYDYKQIINKFSKETPSFPNSLIDKEKFLVEFLCSTVVN